MCTTHNHGFIPLHVKSWDVGLNGGHDFSCLIDAVCTPYTFTTAKHGGRPGSAVQS